jgi:regulator of protease activity HflC (stomatin/prohibitin superfamily)
MRLVVWLVVVAVILGLVYSSLFVVDQTDFVIVKRFGDPVRTLIKPGLKLKYPWPIDTVVRFDNRLMVSPTRKTGPKTSRPGSARTSW